MFGLGLLLLVHLLDGHRQPEVTVLDALRAD